MQNQIAITPIFNVFGEDHHITSSERKELNQLNYDLMNSCRDLVLKGSSEECLNFALQNVSDYVNYFNEKAKDDPKYHFYVWIDSSYNVNIEEYVDYCIDFWKDIHSHDKNSLSREDITKIKDEINKQKEIFRVIDVFKKQNRLGIIERVLIINFFIFRKNEPFGFFLPDGMDADVFFDEYWHDEEDDDDEDDDEYYD